MLALLAQAASSDAWHDGWQLAVVTFTALTIVVGWLHRQSKSDRAEMTADIRGVEGRLTAGMTDLRTELKTDIARVDDKLTTSIADLRTELKTDIAGVEDRLTANITGVEDRLTASIADLRTELKTDIIGVEDRLTANIAEVGGDLKDLKDRLFDDALGQIARYQWQLAVTTPSATSEDPPEPTGLAKASIAKEAIPQ